MSLNQSVVRIDLDTLVAAAREVLKACFMRYGYEDRQWGFKTARSIPMGIGPRQRRAVRQLAALFDEYDPL